MVDLTVINNNEDYLKNQINIIFEVLATKKPEYFLYVMEKCLDHAAAMDTHEAVYDRLQESVWWLQCELSSEEQT